MNIKDKQADRLRFLTRVVEKELDHLLQTDKRIFTRPLSIDDAKRLNTDQDFAERVEAFVSRFGRLQDTLADKLIPHVLTALSENIGPVIDNLDKSERFGWINSVDDWLVMRKLRNLMVHEYVEDLNLLLDALNSGHDFVATLQDTTQKLTAEIRQRSWL